jgi:hypothetical protein
VATIKTIHLLRYTPENISSTRVVTGKWILIFKIFTTRLKNKTWSNPHIEKHQKSYEFRVVRAQTGQRNLEFIYLRFLTTIL